MPCFVFSARCTASFPSNGPITLFHFSGGFPLVLGIQETIVIVAIFLRVFRLSSGHLSVFPSLPYIVGSRRDSRIQDSQKILAWIKKGKKMSLKCESVRWGSAH